MNKKIGIITLNGEYNYGNRLQAYALGRVVEKLGAEYNTLVFSSNNKKLKDHSKKLISKLPIIHPRMAYWRMIAQKQKIFTPFSQKYIKTRVVNSQELSDIDNQYDLFIVGSDQVWNPHYINDQTVNFLSFASPEKRISYAASFGVSDIPAAKQPFYKKHLSQMHNISVREQAGIEIVENLSNKKAKLVPDPTMLLKADDWQKLTANINTKSWGKYIVVYTLRKLDEKTQKAIDNFAKQHQCTIYEIMGDQYQSDLKIPDPTEFIARIANAQAVFTDSFHASVFSIIMHTPFRIFERKDINMSSRLQTLINTYKMTHAMDNLDFDIKQFNFEQSDEILSKQRQKGIEYLQQIFSE